MSAAPKATTNSVCLNHPDQPASSRCTTCFKPVCGECITRAHGEDFCSEQCASNYGATRDTIEEFQQQTDRRRAAKRRRRLIMLIILGVAAYFAYRYIRENPDVYPENVQPSKPRETLFSRSGEFDRGSWAPSAPIEHMPNRIASAGKGPPPVMRRVRR